MIFLILLVTFLLIHHLFYWKVSDLKKYNLKKPDYIAHRGLKINYPENSTNAFIDAHKNQYAWIELDVIASKDGQLFCSHNHDLERETNGRGYLNELSSNSLKSLNIGVNTPKSDLERMPTLEEVFNAIPYTMGINIEIKAHYMFDFTTARALHTFLKKRPVRRAIISSFNPFVLVYFKLFYPRVIIGFLFQNLEYFWMTNVLHPSYIHPRADLLDDHMINKAKKHNLGINVWTVNNKRAINWCKDKGVDGIITDLKVNNV